jgi:YD repeat-containing protein
LIDTLGQHRSVTRAPGQILAASISDTGSLVALLVEGGRLLLLDADFEPVADRSSPPDATTLAVDAHGRYVVVGSRLCRNHLYTKYGKPAGKFETRHALAHLTFVPDRPFLLAAAPFGVILGFDLRAGGASGRLGVEIAWEETLLSNVGRLTTSGDGGMILASCHTHGVQRYDLRGHNEGAYHLGGTAALAVPDFAGRLIAVATGEGELVILSPGGHVRWRSSLTRPATALEVDPLGRFLVYGMATGEIVRLDVESSKLPAVAPAAANATSRAGVGTGLAPAARSIRKPSWTLPVVSTEEQAESAVLTVLDDPPRIGLFSSSSRNRLQVLTTDGKNLGYAPELLGIGRILRTSAGWIASATDRQVALYDARRNLATRLDVSLVEVTHLMIRPDSFGLAVVQERDRVGRVTLAGRWIWKSELRFPVEDLAIGPDGHAALTREDGCLEIYDPGGSVIGHFSASPVEPLCLIEAPDSSPEAVTWLTLARRAQVLRGHDLLGRVAWEAAVPWEGWHLQRVGPLALVNAPDGRALAYDGAGRLRAQARTTGGGPEVFGFTPEGEPWRVVHQGVHLICSDFTGRVRWRTVADEPVGPFACGMPGVAALIGRSLVWFGSE